MFANIRCRKHEQQGSMQSVGRVFEAPLNQVNFIFSRTGSLLELANEKSVFLSFSGIISKFCYNASSTE
jgi:hypothetical protein